MSDYRKYSNTRQLVDFNNAVSGLGDFGLYCISGGVMSIIRVLLKERGLWRSTYVIDRDDGGYFVPSLEDFGQIDEAISEFLGGSDMTCDLKASLLGIGATV